MIWKKIEGCHENPEEGSECIPAIYFGMAGIYLSGPIGDYCSQEGDGGAHKEGGQKERQYGKG